MNNLFSLDNKKVLITGASRGIGFLLARGLAEYGAHILVNATTEENAQRAVEALRREGFRADAAAFDVTNSQAIHAAIEKIEAQSGGIDVLINNAGIQRRHPFTEFPEKTGRHYCRQPEGGIYSVTSRSPPYGAASKR